MAVRTCGGSITATDKNSCKGLTLEVYFSVPERKIGRKCNLLALYKTKVYEKWKFTVLKEYVMLKV